MSLVYVPFLESCSVYMNTYLRLSVPLRQQALLAAISEKDANIALLELSSSNKKKTQEEVLALKREKDRLMHQLKQQVSEFLHSKAHLITHSIKAV